MSNKRTYQCVRCNGILSYEDQINPDEPGEYLHDPNAEGIDENNLAFCPGTENYGYPAPVKPLWWFDSRSNEELVAEFEELPEGWYIVNPLSNFWQGPFDTEADAEVMWEDKYPAERIANLKKTVEG